MVDAYKILLERGFIQRYTHHTTEALPSLLAEEGVRCYVGYDGSASSLHVGHLLSVMALVHLHSKGHCPIVLVGGATTMIGDPSGKRQARKMLEPEEVERNTKAISRQLARYFQGREEVIYVNNADWLGRITLVDFLRQVGSRFTIAEMLTTEAYKTRLEKGLSFLEFSYQLFQAYDFWYLYKNYDCKLQIGGDDQWGNICAGVDLIRRLEGAQVEGLTLPLLLTASGTKMGKTEQGAIWLDPDRTSPYEFYQFWRNTHDQDVERFLKYFTFLPMEEIRKLAQLQGSDIRKAKEVLAFEATKITHGEGEAKKAQKAAHSLFYSASEGSEAIPSLSISPQKLSGGFCAIDAFILAGLCKSRGEVRRKAKEGGLYLNGKKLTDPFYALQREDFPSGEMLLRFGKKKYFRLLLEEN
ncbi:MAG: tyrosine--tRNA ligase [Planctomycetota bacterium]|nr:MAG: tyrosine--tRNA ligase [Planctomycetota bacterium]